MRPSSAWLALPPALVVIATAMVARPESTGAPLDPVIAAEDDRLEERRIALERRRAAKDEVISAVIDGRLTLADAATEFLRLSADDAAVLWSIRREHAGATDEEKMARNVIHFVTLRDLPADEKGRVLVRLHRALAETFGPPVSPARGLPLPKAQPRK